MENIKPDTWSLYNIIPVPKSGDLSKPDNYRGIGVWHVSSQRCTTVWYWIGYGVPSSLTWERTKMREGRATDDPSLKADHRRGKKEQPDSGPVFYWFQEILWLNTQSIYIYIYRYISLQCIVYVTNKIWIWKQRSDDDHSQGLRCPS